MIIDRAQYMFRKVAFADIELLGWASLERHVTKDTSLAFLWHTLTDELVPVENSLYTMTQQWQTMKTLYAQNPAMLPETFAVPAKTENLADFVAEWPKATAEYQQQVERHGDESIMQWVTLALIWLKKILR